MAENSTQSGGDKNIETKQQKQHSLYLKTLGIGMEFGFIIALPLLVFVFIGKWLDNKYHSTLYILAGVLIALASSTLWLYRRINEILKDLRNK